MSEDSLRRKLTAILAADAVGYSRMMSADEERTLRVLAGHRAVIDPLIASRGGRIVNTAGDSVLAEFPSSVDAVRCAIEIQDALQTRNESLPEAERMQFRIGINLGDVVINGDDILGDGVNVAARLESISAPGGICISSSVYDQVCGKLNLGFVDIGEQQLKNINRPIRVYRLDGAVAPERESAKVAKDGRGRRLALGAGIAFMVVALLLVGRWSARKPAEPAPAPVAAPIAQPRPQAQPQQAAPEPPPAPTPKPAPVAKPAPAAPAAAPSWTASAHCAAFRRQEAVDFPLDLRREGERIIVERGGGAGARGRIQLAGVPRPDGRWVLQGAFVLREGGRRLPAYFEGQREGDKVVLTGKLGPRECTLTLSRTSP